MSLSPSVSAVILAGGQGRRMNYKNKGLIKLDGKPLIEHVITRMQSQVDEIIISANENKEQYAQYGLSVVSDQNFELLGPLAGIEAGLKNMTTDYALIVPCDCPFIPLDLASRMISKLSENNAFVCVAQDPERMQPLFTLLHRALLPKLQDSLNNRELKVGRWMSEQAHCVVDYDDPMVFFNINTPEELAFAVQQVSQKHAARIQ